MRRVACLLSLLLLITSCQKQQTKAAQTQPVQSSSYKMMLTTEPAPPVESQETLFKLALTDSSGKPISGADVKAELKMAAMDMGKNEFSLNERSVGNYEGKGKFTMSGPWNVVVTAKQGGGTEQQAFQILAHRK